MPTLPSSGYRVPQGGWRLDADQFVLTDDDGDAVDELSYDELTPTMEVQDRGSLRLTLYGGHDRVAVDLASKADAELLGLSLCVVMAERGQIPSLQTRVFTYRNPRVYQRSLSDLAQGYWTVVNVTDAQSPWAPVWKLFDGLLTRWLWGSPRTVTVTCQRDLERFQLDSWEDAPPQRRRTYARRAPAR